MELCNVMEAVKGLDIKEQTLIYLQIARVLSEAGVEEASFELATKDGRRGRLVAEVSYRQEMGEYER